MRLTSAHWNAATWPERNVSKRPLSTIAPEWWDYTTLDPDLIDQASRLTPRDLPRLSRSGFTVVLYDTLEEFYLAEALEYVQAWRQSTDDNPVGICGPIGPTEQLPLVARMVNELNLDVRSGHFWGMDEWFDASTGREVPVDHPLSFERADRELCFSRIRRGLRMPDAHLHFPKADTRNYGASWDSGVRCAVMQGGQGDVKHWAFNDPLPRKGRHKDAPPSPAEYRKLTTRVVDLHPLTIAQNARTSGGGNIAIVPTKAITVGPVETWKAEKVSIWHAGQHDNPFGQRLTALMISKGIVDTSVPMSLLAEHPNVQFSYFRGGLGTCAVQMH
jgi:glucosamine-6-phosphate deaminase